MLIPFNGIAKLIDPNAHPSHFENYRVAQERMEKDSQVESWQCPICTLINSYAFDVCEACGTTSPHVLAAMVGQDHAEAKDDDEERDRASSTSTRPSRGSSIEEDYKAAAQLDPWAQAEDEWAVVEATQATKVKRK